MNAVRALAVEVALQACEGSEIVFAIVYGSAVRAAERTRDVDVLVICRDTKNRVVRSEAAGHALHLHVVDADTVRADIEEDRYGWVLLTKLLDDFEVIHGSESAADAARRRAFLRLMAQWLSEHKSEDVKAISEIHDGCTSVLRRWNPRDGRLELDQTRAKRLRAYVRRTFVRTEDFQGLLVESGLGFSLNADSVFARYVDLRIVLIKFWCFYVLYQLDPALYLDPIVDKLLRKKGLIE